MADLDGLLPTATEEMLRYTSPVVHFRRTVTEDTVVRDQPIAEGEKVVVFYGSGNRDEDVFDRSRPLRRRPRPEPPHGLRRRRSRTCASACTWPGSRSSPCCASCSTRLPDLEPAGEPERLASNFIAGVRTMPVRYTPR